jgi:hypothetical protein
MLSYKKRKIKVLPFIPKKPENKSFENKKSIRNIKILKKINNSNWPQGPYGPVPLGAVFPKILSFRPSIYSRKIIPYMKKI